jgi:hypothetical protein
LAFLISGPATNAATLTTLWRVLGRRTVIIFLLTVAVGAIVSGWAVDGLIGAGVVPATAILTPTDVTGHDHGRASAGNVSWWLQQVAAVALLLVLGNALRPRRAATRSEEETMAASSRSSIELKISGMRCNGCVQSVTRALQEVEGVESVDVQLEGGVARVTGTPPMPAALGDAVTSLGFTLENPEVLVAAV